MRKPVKLTLLGVGAAALLGVGALAASKRGPKAAEVKTEPVSRRDLVASVTASGQVARTSRSTSPPTSAGASCGSR
jgi:multidrug efflux pump subunit AcrA (membrane-fusion protein)